MDREAWPATYSPWGCTESDTADHRIAYTILRPPGWEKIQPACSSRSSASLSDEVSVQVIKAFFFNIIFSLHSAINVTIGHVQKK